MLDPTLEAKFSELFERYYAAVVKLFIRWGFPREEARDLAQETFLRLLRGMAGNRGEGYWSFLRTIAKNIALNVLRERGAAKRRALEVSLEGLPLLPDEAANDPWTGRPPPSAEDEIVERQEREEHERLSRRLRQAIAALPPANRSCLLLKLGGRSIREIAIAFGTTEDAVKARLKIARKGLTASLREHPASADIAPRRPQAPWRNHHDPAN